MEKGNCRTNGSKLSINTRSGLLEPAVPTDRRIQRTRGLLKDALFQLITERDYESVAIQDITDRANLGRTTFYLHYQDKEELLRASVKSLMYELQSVVEPETEESCPYLLRFIRIFQHVGQRQALYAALLKETSPVNIGNLMRDYFSELFGRYVQIELNLEDISDVTAQIIAAHAAGSLFGLISWWLSGRIVVSAEKMGAIYFQLLSSGSADLVALA